jgi:hypothetical protein
MTKTTKMLLAAMLLAVLVFLPGCGGAKKTCKKSAESYFSMLSSSNWSGIYKMLTEEHRKKIGSKERFARFMEEELEFMGSKKFTLKSLQVYPGKDSCNVQIDYSYWVKLMGQDEKEFPDNPETLIFKKSPKDQRWYMEIPAASNLAGFNSAD